MHKRILIVLISTICLSFSSDLQKKVIRSNNFDIECYVTSVKPVGFYENKIYYWYRSGEIHATLSNAGGEVLHKGYLKYYRSNQLAEQGEFNYGLKIGHWKTWYKNGNLKAIETWFEGYRQGNYTAFDSLGNIAIEGKYRNNLKQGYWIDHVKKDTTYHRNNEMFDERPKNLMERLLRKRDSLEKIQIKTEKIAKRKADSIKRIKIKEDRKIKKKNDSIQDAIKKQQRLLKK